MGKPAIETWRTRRRVVDLLFWLTTAGAGAAWLLRHDRTLAFALIVTAVVFLVVEFAIIARLKSMDSRE